MLLMLHENVHEIKKILIFTIKWPLRTVYIYSSYRNIAKEPPETVIVIISVIIWISIRHIYDIPTTRIDNRYWFCYFGGSGQRLIWLHCWRIITTIRKRWSWSWKERWRHWNLSCICSRRITGFCRNNIKRGFIIRVNNRYGTFILWWCCLFSLTLWD